MSTLWLLRVTIHIWCCIVGQKFRHRSHYCCFVSIGLVQNFTPVFSSCNKWAQNVTTSFHCALLCLFAAWIAWLIELSSLSRCEMTCDRALCSCRSSFSMAPLVPVWNVFAVGCLMAINSIVLHVMTEQAGFWLRRGAVNLSISEKKNTKFTVLSVVDHLTCVVHV